MFCKDKYTIHGSHGGWLMFAVEKQETWNLTVGFMGAHSAKRANRLKLLGIIFLIGKVKFKLLFHGPLAELVRKS